MPFQQKRVGKNILRSKLKIILKVWQAVSKLVPSLSRKNALMLLPNFMEAYHCMAGLLENFTSGYCLDYLPLLFCLNNVSQRTYSFDKSSSYSSVTNRQFFARVKNHFFATQTSSNSVAKSRHDQGKT